MSSAAVVPSQIQEQRERAILLQNAIANPEIAVAELCRRSLYEFLQTFWSCFSTDEPLWNWHIKYLCDELEIIAEHVSLNLPKKYDLIINVPPGTTKSTTCSIAFPIWCWLKWPWMRFIVSSYSGILSLEHAEVARDTIRSKLFKRLFSDLTIKEDKDTKSNYRIVSRVGHRGQKTGGNRYSTSVGGTMTGYHGHILIVDDPLNPQQAASDTELYNVNRWFEQTLPTRRIEKSVTPTILIMQRLHQNDPTGFLLNKKSNIRHICIPGEIRNFKYKLNPPELERYYKDDLLDPVRMSWSVLKELEVDLGQYGYAGQIGQDPVPPGGGMFKVENFITINTPPKPLDVQMIVRYWDKAGTADGGAYTAGIKMAKLRHNAGFVILDMVRGQWAAMKREQVIRRTAELDGKNVYVYVEQEPGSGGKESAEATIRNLAGWSVHADRPTGDKVLRADPYSVQVNNRNVTLLEGEWNKDLIDEHRWFPYGTYKDIVDASAAAFNVLTGKKRAGVLLKRNRRADREEDTEQKPRTARRRHRRPRRRRR